MKTAVMQPYLFPYIGYWQLLNAVEQFVILDDVNFIKRGYINRNNILMNGRAYMFSVPIKNISQNRLIMDTELSFDEKEKRKFLARIESAYKKADQFDVVMPVLKMIIENDTRNLTEYIQNSIEKIMDYLGIHTSIMRSSEIAKDNSLKAQDRIIEICKQIHTDVYINPAGGRALYQVEKFREHNMELFFLDTRFEQVIYKQFDNEFVANLSIIDMMMFNSVEKIQSYLLKYKLSE